MKIDLPPFESARVLVVGDAMLDRYWHGGASRISPEAPVPVVRVQEAEERPGGAGNVALNIAALGTDVSLLAVTGEDEAATTLEQALQSAGVRCTFERTAGVHTVTKLRVMSRHQQLIRLDFEDDFDGYRPDRLLNAYEQALSRCDLVLLSDYGKGTLGPVRQLIDSALERNLPVLVDPKAEGFERYRGASLITPNLSEFEHSVGTCESEQDIEERGTQLLAAHGIGALLITRGERGMTLLRPDSGPLHMPTEAREVFDVTGAGDTVISVLAAALAAGATLESATALANLAAGVVVGKLGTASASIPELRRAAHDLGWGGKILHQAGQLVEAVADAHAHGETVVMTNGCFDLLHAGHVGYLEQARRLGDRLVVAVNDDASVRRLKGPQRPLNSVQARMEVLAALRCVDWVVAFSEDTPQQLICEVQPNVLVKGGDYRPWDIAGHDCVRETGGDVVVLDYREGHSTSGVIERIRGR